MRYESMYEEFEVSTPATYVTGLPFGEGKIGLSHALNGPEEFEKFGAALAEHTVALTKSNTADCVDERETIALGNGERDMIILEQRVVPQMAGGLGLAVTKAAVGADLAILRDAKDFTDAYLKMYDILTLLGYEDGGHGDCGASKKAEESVFNEINQLKLMMALPLFTPVDDSTPRLLGLNSQTKRQRLESGFYSGWSNGWHEGFLGDKVPQNYSLLAVDANDLETHGHHGSGAYAVLSPGMGFAKNRFIHATGRESFAATVSTADELTANIINKIGGSPEERARLRLEFGVDPPQVLNRLVIEGLPVFAEAA